MNIKELLIGFIGEETNFEEFVREVDDSDLQDLTQIVQSLEGLPVKDIYIEEQNVNGSYYYSIAYFSPKLKKTIILSYDVFGECIDLDSFSKRIGNFIKEIEEIENKINI